MSKRSCLCSCFAPALALALALVAILDFGLADQAMASDRARAAGANLTSDVPVVGIDADYAVAGCDGRGTRLQAVVEPGSAVAPLTFKWSGPGLAGLAGPEAVVVDSLAPGTHTYSLVVTAGEGLVSEAATYSLTVLPAIDCSIDGPDLVCPASVTAYCGPAGGSSYAWTITGGGTIVGSSTDQCVEIRASSRCASQFNLTLRVGSGTGCPSICSRDITVFDITPPVITCPVDVTLDCGASTDPGMTGTPTATDACDTMPELTYSDVAAPGTCPVLMTITRTWRAADDCGNSATCVQTIRLVDDAPPELDCPPDTTIECDESSDPSNTGRATATDACGQVIEVTYSDQVSPGDCPEAFFIDRLWSAMDDCGNVSTCHQLIAVVDTTPPEITCPADTTTACGEPADPAHTGWATARDNCDDQAPVTYDDEVAVTTDPCGILITRTWKATDQCGNEATCVQLIVCVDDLDPEFTSTPAPYLKVDCGSVPRPPALEASDLCDHDVYVQFGEQREPGSCEGEYTLIRTWTAWDDCGHWAEFVQTIDVIDTLAPYFTTPCPIDVTVSCNRVPLPQTMEAEDDCIGPVPVDFDEQRIDGDCPGDYSLVRSWIAQDDCGNTVRCSQTITLVDVTPPAITCPPDLTVECTDPTDPDHTGRATALDSCDANPRVTYVDVLITGPCPEAYRIERTWTAWDYCDNQASCVQTIAVVDTTPPVIVCPPDTTIQCNGPTDPDHTGYATAWDNCDPVVVPGYDDEILPGTVPQSHRVARTWTATDDCGNQSDCVQMITVLDVGPPWIECPPDVSVPCGQPTDPDHTGHAEAGDDCGNQVDVTWSDQTTPGNCPQELVITRTWMARNSLGDTASCMQAISVVDDLPPVLTCPPNGEFECDEQPEFGEATAVDNCDREPAITYVDNLIPGGSPQEYVIERTWTAADDCGNTAQCVQRVSVVDETGPMLVPAPDDRVLCDQPVVFTDPEIDDYCDPEPTLSVVSNTVTPGPGECEYTYTRCWRGEDAAGNFSSTVCQNIIRYEDDEPPVLTCAPDKEIQPGDPVVFDEPTVTDNCPIGGPDFPDLSYTQSSSVEEGETTYTRCWIAYDICGNESNECCQNITLRDEPTPDPYCSFVCWNWTAACLRDPYNHEISTPPACLRDEHFDGVFPEGVTIGTHSKPGLHTATWTSAGAVERFKCGYKLPEPLYRDWVDPLNTDLGALQAELLTLKLNREFSCQGHFEAYGYPLGDGCFGDLVVPMEGLRFAGLTVDQFLAIADLAVAGDKSVLLPYGYSYYKLHATAAYLNWLHGECNGYGTRNDSGPVVLGGTEEDAGWEDEVGRAVPAEFWMTGSPNPMRGSVTITLALPAAGDVSLDIYDVRGRVVTTLLRGHESAGYYSVTWDGADGFGARVISGIYFCRVQIDGRPAAMEKLLKL